MTFYHTETLRATGLVLEGKGHLSNHLSSQSAMKLRFASMYVLLFIAKVTAGLKSTTETSSLQWVATLHRIV
jgi:hypothetical protein